MLEAFGDHIEDGGLVIDDEDRGRESANGSAELSARIETALGSIACIFIKVFGTKLGRRDLMHA
ncbi:MAG: hypothetical protein EXR00_08635 [Alphaproteobacteria bacterium]|nr:hypothetical protein [Alphaproteobacteria bacterium]